MKLHELTGEKFTEMIGACGWKHQESWKEPEGGLLVARFVTTESPPLIVDQQDPDNLQSPHREVWRAALVTTLCGRCPLCDGGALESGEEPASGDMWRAQALVRRLDAPLDERPVIDLDDPDAGEKLRVAGLGTPSYVLHGTSCVVPFMLGGGVG